MELLLVVQDGGYVGVVISVLFGTLAVVEIDQHVSQVLVQSILDIVSILLGLTPLLLGVVSLSVLLMVLG